MEMSSVRSSTKQAVGSKLGPHGRISRVAAILPVAFLVWLYQGIQGSAVSQTDIPSSATKQQSFRPHANLSAESGTSPEESVAAGWRSTLLGLGVVGFEDDPPSFISGSDSLEQGADASSEYTGILDKLERIVRHENPDSRWLNIELEPYRGGLQASTVATLATDSEPDKEDFAVGSMLQLKSSRKPPAGTQSVLDAQERTDGPMGMQQISTFNSAGVSFAQAIAGGTGNDTEPLSTATYGSDGTQLFTEAVNDFRVAIDEGSLKPQIDIQYTFPMKTHESRDIAFIVLALPQGYAVRGNANDSTVCKSTEPTMPPLKCKLKVSSSKRASEGNATFIVVSSADPTRNLPLGRHSFKIPAEMRPANVKPVNTREWWFATFRFTGGHAITKHFEDKKLLARRKCIWSEWRNETPCSTTCGGGFEVWTRMLFAGPSEGQCGGAILKRKCQTEACSLSCQLMEWEPVTNCTRDCGAKDGEAFRVRIRRVLKQSLGWGQSCSKLYPWDDTTREGWSERLQAVVSLAPCDVKFQAECPAEMGCRVEEVNTRTMPASFPWGVCPFPCGGFGTITSIVQVANGIPRWIGQKHYPDTFQIPCKADKEPLVTTRKCNTQACEDCSVFLENPEFGKATRAWIFFLPTLEGDTMEITAPKGMTIISSPPAPEQLDLLRNGKISRLSHILPSPGISLEAPKGAHSAKREHDRQMLGNCLFMANSFGGIKTCKVGMSQHYRGLQSAHVTARALIAPSGSRPRLTTPPKEARAGPRPHWIALPVILGEQTEMENHGSFFLWLTTSSMPRDPEVFRCRLRTQLTLPEPCALSYTPRNPEDCKNCNPNTRRSIEAYRRFVPAKHGGSCNVPASMRIPKSILTTVSCELSCGHMPHGVANTSQQEQAKAPRNKPKEPLSTVKHIGRMKLQWLLERKELSKASPGGTHRLDTTILVDTTGGVGDAVGGERALLSAAVEAALKPVAVTTDLGRP